MTVILRKYSMEDKADLIELSNAIDRTYLSGRLPFPYTKEDADWWINRVSEHDGTDGIFRLIIADGRIAGSISIEQKADIYKRDADIGYTLHTDSWSKGIMTKAVRMACDIAFDELDIIRITALVHGQNIASRKVLEKNGFILEGVMRKAIVKSNSISDLCIYGLTR